MPQRRAGQDGRTHRQLDGSWPLGGDQLGRDGALAEIDAAVDRRHTAPDHHLPDRRGGARPLAVGSGT